MKQFLPLLLVCAGCARLSAAEPVRYWISLRQPAQHLLHVKMQVPATAPFDLQLPVWNGTYQVRDFAQYVQGVESNGRIRRIAPSTWHVEPPPGATQVEIRYETYADIGGPFGFQLNERHAFLNLAMCLMFSPTATRNSPVELRFTDLPKDWKIGTALSESKDVFRAEDYDHLVDAPMEISAFQEVVFQNGSAIYHVVVHAADRTPTLAELRKLGDMVEKIAAYETGLMRDTPFVNYTFLYEFGSRGGGGMEHANSTAIAATMPADNSNWDSAASVTAHEFFHLWNVKRIRPQSLEPVDYMHEMPVRALWFSEGVTSTYGEYTLLRSGLQKRQDFLNHVQRLITNLERLPAVRRQPVEESSLETWYDKYPYYRRSERSISYYDKGEIAGYLLDLAIRNASGNRHSLDDLMRAMNQRFALHGLFFDEDRDIQKVAEELAGQPMQEFFDTLIRSAAPVDYAKYFAYAGFAVDTHETARADAGFSAMRNVDAALAVTQPDSGGLLRVGDVIREINGHPAGGNLRSEIDALQPGDEITLKIERNSHAQYVTLKAGRQADRDYSLKEMPNPTPMQVAIRKGWLEGK